MTTALRHQSDLAVDLLPHCRTCTIGALGVYAAAHATGPAAVAGARRGASIARANTLLTRAAEHQSHIRMLRRGWAIRVAQLADGRRQVLSFILPGDLFDLEALLLLSEGASSYTTRALTDVEFCTFSTTAMHALLNSTTEQSRRFQTYLQNQLALYGRRLTDLGQRAAPGRLSNLLLELHSRLAERGLAKDSVYDMPARQDDLADALGLTPVHVNRTLRGLRERGLIDFHRGVMRLLDIRGLEIVAEEE